MSRDNKETVIQEQSQKHSESESLLAHEQIWSHSVEIFPASAKGWPQALFDMSDSTQKIKVGSELAPSFHQNSEGQMETPAPSQNQSVGEIDQTKVLYSMAQNVGHRVKTESSSRPISFTLLLLVTLNAIYRAFVYISQLNEAI